VFELRDGLKVPPVAVSEHVPNSIDVRVHAASNLATQQSTAL